MDIDRSCSICVELQSQVTRPGLVQHAIAEWKLTTFTSTDEECPICLQEIPNPSIVHSHPSEPNPNHELPVQTPCKHHFGHRCLTTWLNENDSCPTCRAKLIIWDEPVRRVSRRERREDDSSLQTEESERMEMPEPISRRFSDVVLGVEVRNSMWERMPILSRRFSEIILRPGLSESMWAPMARIDEEVSDVVIGTGLSASMWAPRVQA